MMTNFFEQTRGGLIVSCQALENEPLHDPAIMARMAVAAAQGGACGIRANSVADIRAIQEVVSLPIIGIIKKEYTGSEVYITPTMAEIDALVAVGADVIALDATVRTRPGNLSTGQFFAQIRKKYPNQLFMADCATLVDGIFAEVLGFDIISSTLCGYTQETRGTPLPSYDLLEQFALRLHTPIIAEGGIWQPDQLAHVLSIDGIHCAVIGTAITRPREITQRFLRVVSQVRYAPAHSKILAFDIGATNTKYGLFDHSAQPVMLNETSTRASLGADYILNSICDIVQKYDHLDAVGISTSGQVSPKDGSVLFATQSLPGYTGVPLRKLLEQRLHLPVHVGNDVNCAALGEAVFGAGRGVSDFLCLTYGTGIGGAIVINHTVMTGANGIAGEVGHMITHKDGAVCACGGRGCYEHYASTKALEARVRAVWPHALSGEQIFCMRDEPIISREIDAWIDEIVCGLVSLTCIFNPKCIILGGGVMRQSFICHEVENRLHAQLIPSFNDISIKQAQIGNYSGLYGAYYNALHYNDAKEQD